MNSVIILAGGKGKRMGTDISKQFINVKDKPILYYTLKKFIDNKNIDNIVLVLPSDEIEYCKREVLDKYNLKVDKIVVGGAERQDSVYNGLMAIEDSEIILIHDGARAFLSDEIINNGIKYAKEYGAAAPGVTPKDTIKIKGSDSFSESTPDRDKLIAIQTPQVFKKDLILSCHQKIKEQGESVTDDTMVVEKYGHKVYLYEGDYSNIKVTTPEDLILAEKLI